MNFIDRIKGSRADNEIERQLWPAAKFRFYIRAYEAKDREALLHLYDANAPDRFPEGSRPDFEKFLDTEEKSLFVVENPQLRLLACGGVAAINPLVHILCFGLVDPEFQGQRIGTTLTLARLVFATRTSGTHCSIISAVSKSMSFYQRFGYERASTWKAPDDAEHPIGLLAYDPRVMDPIRTVLKRRGFLIDPTLPLCEEKQVDAEVIPSEGGGVSLKFTRKGTNGSDGNEASDQQQ